MLASLRVCMYTLRHGRPGGQGGAGPGVDDELRGELFNGRDDGHGYRRLRGVAGCRRPGANHASRRGGARRGPRVLRRRAARAVVRGADPLLLLLLIILGDHLRRGGGGGVDGCDDEGRRRRSGAAMNAARVSSRETYREPPA